MFGLSIQGSCKKHNKCESKDNLLILCKKEESKLSFDGGMLVHNYLSNVAINLIRYATISAISANDVWAFLRKNLSLKSI